MDSDTELQVCLVVNAKSVSMVRASPDGSSDNPEKEGAHADIGARQASAAHLCGRGKWKPFPTSSLGEHTQGALHGDGDQG